MLARVQALVQLNMPEEGETRADTYHELDEKCLIKVKNYSEPTAEDMSGTQPSDEKLEQQRDSKLEGESDDRSHT